MAIKLNQFAVEKAKYVIKADEVDPKPGNWETHRPTENDIVEFINCHTMQEYGKWFLGENTDIPDNARQHYVYPTGDLKIVHLSALMLAEQQATKNNHPEIARAARELIQLIEKKEKK